MYIHSLIPRNFAELTESVPIDLNATAESSESDEGRLVMMGLIQMQEIANIIRATLKEDITYIIEASEYT